MRGSEGIRGGFEIRKGGSRKREGEEGEGRQGLSLSMSASQ